MKPYRKFNPFQIRWKESLGRSECPYMFRWVFNLGIVSIRVHKWLRSDDLRYKHNHPGWFITFVLRGYYDDISPEGVDRLSRFSIRFRRATHLHSVKVPPEGCLTLLICGPHSRNWAFLVNGKFKRPLAFFHKYGNPPCDIY